MYTLSSNFSTQKLCLVSVSYFLMFGNISSTNFIMVYDYIFHQQLAGGIFPVHNNRTVELIGLYEGNSSLQSVMSSLENTNTNDIILLFTKYDILFEKILKDQRLVLKYGISIQNMEIFNVNSQQISSCLAFNQTLHKSLVELIKSLSHENVAIVTNEEICARKFYSKLENSVYAISNDGFRRKLTHIVHPLQQSTVQTLKSSDISAIVLLLPHQHIPMFLKNTSWLNLLGKSFSWVIPSFREELISSRWFSGNILSFEIADTKFPAQPYINLGKGVNELIIIYEKLKNLITSLELSIQIHQVIQRYEENTNLQHNTFHLNLKYRESTMKASKWINDVAIIHENSTRLMKHSIPILQTDNQENQEDEVIKAVTVITNPFGLERKDMYIPTSDSCQTGVKCQKPVKKNNTLFYEPTCCTGFTIEMFMHVMEIVNKTFSFYIVPDGKYGGIGKDGKWNGMIGEIVEGKADLAVAGLSVITSRSQVVDFTPVYMQTQIGIVTRSSYKKSVGLINFEFISIIPGQSLMMLWIIIVGSMFVCYVLENCVFFQSLTNIQFPEESYYPFNESVSYIGGIVLQRDLGGKNPKRKGARFAALAFAGSMMIFITSYTAKLAAANIQYVEENPFKGSKDPRMVNPTSSFRFATLKSSSFETFFNTSESKVIRRMSRFMQAYNVESTAVGVKKVINGDLEAYIANYQFISWSIARYNACDLKVHRDTLRESGYGFAMKKNFKLKELINEAVQQIVESNKAADLYNKWFRNTCQDSSNTHKAVPRDITYFSGLLFILCVTAIACFPLVVLEHLHMRMKKVVVNNIKRIFGIEEKYHLQMQENDDEFS